MERTSTPELSQAERLQTMGQQVDMLMNHYGADLHHSETRGDVVQGLSNPIPLDRQSGHSAQLLAEYWLNVRTLDGKPQLRSLSILYSYPDANEAGVDRLDWHSEVPETEDSFVAVEEALQKIYAPTQRRLNRIIGAYQRRQKPSARQW